MTSRVWLILALAASACGRVGFDALVGSDGSKPSTFCSSADLAGCYELEGEVSDGTPNGNDATQATGITFIPGRVGMAALFDASSIVLLADTPSLDITGPITVEAWVRLDAAQPVSNRWVIIDRNKGFAMHVTNAGELQANLELGPVTRAVTGGIVPIGTWFHVALTHDGATAVLWLDGVEAGRVDAAGVLQTADTEGTRIGGDLPVTSGPDPWIGAIDQLRIWSVVRTASEICEAAGPC